MISAPCRALGAVLSGFIGIGESTRLDQVLNSRKRRNVAVIVRHMREVNIDADLIRESGANLARMDEKLVEIANGCVCCTLRGDLLVEVRCLRDEGRFDYLLIEGTGIARPMPVASTFSFRDEDVNNRSDVARLGTIAPVGDAAHLLKDCRSNDFPRDRGETSGEADEDTLVHPFLEQMKFAEVVILNKVTEVTPEALDLVHEVVVALNPSDRIIETASGQVGLSDIFNTKLFDEGKRQQHPPWSKELYGHAEHLPETEDYGIQNFVYRTRCLSHPERFRAFINATLPGLIRAKGLFWLATRPRWVVEFSPAGATVRMMATGHWWSAIPKQHWPDHPEWRRPLGRPAPRAGVDRDWHG